MARPKKQSRKERVAIWLKDRPKVLIALAVLFICLGYLPVHAYHIYADNRKFDQTRLAMSRVYSDISQSLGQPDNLKRSNSCYKTSGLLRSSSVCSLEIDFIYGIASQPQADVILKHIQAVISASKLFRPAGKLSASITDKLVFDTYYHDALDHYSGPHHIACSIKYSFDTPEEVDLSLNSSGTLPLEIFFSCSAPANHAVYPSI